LYRRNGYIHCQDNEENIIQPKSIFQSCKEYISKKYNRLYYQIFGKQKDYGVSNNPMNIPLTEISIHNHSKTFSKEDNIEKNLFDNHIQELCTNSISIEFNDKIYDHNSQYNSDYNHYFDVNYKSSEFESRTFTNDINRMQGASIDDIDRMQGTSTDDIDRMQGTSTDDIDINRISETSSLLLDTNDFTLKHENNYNEISEIYKDSFQNYKIDSIPFVLDFDNKKHEKVQTPINFQITNSRSLDIIFEHQEDNEDDYNENQKDNEDDYNEKQEDNKNQENDEDNENQENEEDNENQENKDNYNEKRYKDNYNRYNESYYNENRYNESYYNENRYNESDEISNYVSKSFSNFYEYNDNNNDIVDQIFKNPYI
jgi:hypothetical protein